MKTYIKFLIITSLTILMSVGNAMAHVSLDYPTGGETFIAGEIITIHWHQDIPHNQENWDLYFSPDGGASWQIIKLDMIIAQTSYQWAVPEIVTVNAQIRIVQDNVNADYDDYSMDFTIIPNATSVEDSREIPDKFMLFANYPNPFNPSTVIEYSLPAFSVRVSLKVYDILGNEVATLVNRQQQPGTYKVNFDASNLPSGTYIYRLISGDFNFTRKMILLK